MEDSQRRLRAEEFREESKKTRENLSAAFSPLAEQAALHIEQFGLEKFYRAPSNENKDTCFTSTKKGDGDTIFKVRLGKEACLGQVRSVAVNGGGLETYPKGTSLKIFIPLGEYGESFAESCIMATRSLYRALNSTMAEKCKEFDAEHKQLIEKSTFMNNSLLSLCEGALTIAASIGVLESQRMEGYDDPVSLASELVEHQIVDRLARHLPFGVIFPMAMTGHYFENALVHRKGQVDLNPRLVNLLDGARDFKMKYGDLDVAGSTNHGCPVAYKVPEFMIPEGQPIPSTTGIHRIGSLWIKALKHYSK